MSFTPTSGPARARRAHITALFVCACAYALPSHAAQSDLEREQAKLEAEEARIQAELAQIEKEIAASASQSAQTGGDLGQTKASMDQLQLWMNPQGRTGAQIRKQQDDWIVAAAKNAAVPRAAGTLVIRRDNAAAVDVNGWRGRTVMLATVLAQDPMLEIYLDTFEELGGIRVALVLIDESRGPPQVAARLKRSTAIIGQAEGRELRAFMQQGRIYSGTFVVIDPQGQVRYQGPMHKDMLTSVLPNLSSGGASTPAPAAQPPTPSSAAMTETCHKSYHDAAVAGNHLSTWDSNETREWCRCVAGNIRSVLTPSELGEYMKSPVAFIRQVTADPTPSNPRDWRLFTPVTSCWR